MENHGKVNKRQKELGERMDEKHAYRTGNIRRKGHVKNGRIEQLISHEQGAFANKATQFFVTKMNTCSSILYTKTSSTQQTP